jgi:hypothetical protein
MKRAKHFTNDGDPALVVASEHGAPVAPQDRAFEHRNDAFARRNGVHVSG